MSTQIEEEDIVCQLVGAPHTYADTLLKVCMNCSQDSELEEEVNPLKPKIV